MLQSLPSDWPHFDTFQLEGRRLSGKVRGFAQGYTLETSGLRRVFTMRCSNEALVGILCGGICLASFKEGLLFRWEDGRKS